MAAKKPAKKRGGGSGGGRSFLSTCALLVLFKALVIGVSFYALERSAGNWFEKQAFPMSGTETFESSKGNVPLPIVYYDGSLVGAFYLVDPAVAQSLLPKSMEPLTLPWPIEKAIAGIFMFDYRNTSIGRYGEMGLTIQAKKAGSGAGLLGYTCDMIGNVYHLDWLLSLCEQTSTGLYVSTLPVTTAEAMAAGREIWGYNKYLSTTKSDFDDPARMSFQLGDEFAFELDSAARPLPFSMAGLPFLTYTEHGKEKKIMRTKVHVGHKASWGGEAKLRFIGDGETSRKMRKLNLDKLPVAAVFRTDSLQAHLPRGEYV